MKVSVIMPAERLRGDADRAIAAVLGQSVSFEFELIVIVADELLGPVDAGVIRLVCADRNPARRRNAAAAIARGEILAFIDDDAFAEPVWLANAVEIFDRRQEILALGGPDPAPPDSTIAELISDTLLATPWIGSGVAAHENRAGTFEVRSPHDLALVNLLVRREAFHAAGGLDESIGYIGEDTALIERLLEQGVVLYCSEVVVRHRRRAFPGPYLAQRWRYRVKTGRMLVGGKGRYHRNPKLIALLGAGFGFLVALVTAPMIAAALLAVYGLVTFIAGSRATRLPARWWPILPPALLAHHATYWLGIVWGIVLGAVNEKRGQGSGVGGQGPLSS